jgi:hypothetical protein
VFVSVNSASRESLAVTFSYRLYNIDRSYSVPQVRCLGGRGKVKLSLCLIKHYAIKTLECRYGSTILDLGTKWR